MTTDLSLRPYAAPVGTAVRAVARRAPGSIAQARFRAQPTAAFIARLTATAVFAYLLTFVLPGTARSVLAPLTAVLVVQATLYQTVRSAIQRVVSVVAGVLVALVFSAARAAATGRIVDTLVGTAAGLAGGILLSPVRTQPAEDAIGSLSRQMADLLEEIASGLAGGSDPGETEAWLMRARGLTGEIQRADDALGEAEDSLRFRPPPLRSARTAVPLRNGLETLEHAAVTIRGLAHSITDDARLPADDGAALAADALDMLAEVLRRLAAAVRAYGGLVRADLTHGRVPDGSELERHLAEARQHQDCLAPVLRHTPDVTSAGWPLRGEILVHLDRLTNSLQPSTSVVPVRTRQARRGFRRAVRAA